MEQHRKNLKANWPAQSSELTFRPAQPRFRWQSSGAACEAEEPAQANNRETAGKVGTENIDGCARLEEEHEPAPSRRQICDERKTRVAGATCP